ncbi:hypothetical protein DXG01_002333 [Tephrocybe rancida]|nr:hypothetical protein DXG01_002333 [Tephrocybe rancida]
MAPSHGTTASILGTCTRDSVNTDDAPGLRVGPRKKMTVTDPLTHSGRHFSRAVYCFADVRSLITQGFKRTTELEREESRLRASVLERWTATERQEFAVYKSLLDICEGLEERLSECESPEQIQLLADLIEKGASSARASDTKGMKPSIIDWITPADGHLTPPLNRHTKFGRRFNHDVTGALLTPAGVDWENPEIRIKLASGEKIVAGHHWPIFIYANNKFDPNDPWKGLLRSGLLVKAFKHVFITPSSADLADGTVTTKSGNAKIHGMKRVTKASIVYIVTQVRFALTTAAQWLRGDKVTDSQNFYTSLLKTLENPVHNRLVLDLLVWWDSKIFPHYVPEATLIPLEGSPLDRIQQMAAESSTAEYSSLSNNLLNQNQLEANTQLAVLSHPLQVMWTALETEDLSSPFSYSYWGSNGPMVSVDVPTCLLRYHASGSREDVNYRNKLAMYKACARSYDEISLQWLNTKQKLSTTHASDNLDNFRTLCKELVQQEKDLIHALMAKSVVEVQLANDGIAWCEQEDALLYDMSRAADQRAYGGGYPSIPDTEGGHQPSEE